ncbi:hypothetical protein BC829DRAFT_379881 [Chytridium lagenaria]|nr:hypothetical protein BC829DRAFT_379881 [Chytridium lagenaria]
MAYSRGKGKWSNGPPNHQNAFGNGHQGARDKAQNGVDHQKGPVPSNISYENWDRILFVLMNSVGAKVSVTVRDGTVYEGVLHTANTYPDLGVVLKSARTTKPELGTALIPTMVVLPRDFVSMSVIALESVNGLDKFDSGKGISTDSAIGAKLGDFGKERELMKWSMDDTSIALSLDDDKGDARWDQFSTNERLFGVQTDFEEELYTTAIDKEAEAARIAREMETEAQTRSSENPHMLEERNMSTNDEGVGEEEKYSKYVPPGARGGNSQSGLTPRHQQMAAAAASKKAAAETALPEAPPAKVIKAGKTVPAADTESKAEVEVAPKIQQSAKVAAPVPHNEVVTPVASSKVVGESDKLKTIPSAQPTRTVSSDQRNDQKDVKAGKPDLLTKLPLKKTLNENPSNVKEKDTVGNFANQERRQMPTKFRDLLKKKEDIINDFKSFSSNFKLNTPIPADLAQMLKKEKQSALLTPSDSAPLPASAKDSKPPMSAGPSAQASDSKTKQQLESQSDASAPPKSEDEASKASTAVTETPEGDAPEAPRFKLNVAAMEFKPLGPALGASSNLTPQRVKSPGHEKVNYVPAFAVILTSASVSGNPRQNSNSRNSYGKGFQKNSQNSLKQPNAGAPAWTVGGQYRPQFVPEYQEGGVYVGGMDMNQQYMAYPVAAPYGQYPRGVQVMAPRPFIPGMAPPMPMPGPGGAIPAYHPYLQQFSHMPQMPGYPPHQMMPPPGVRVYQPGQPMPPQGGHTAPPPGNGKNGAPPGGAQPGQGPPVPVFHPQSQMQRGHYVASPPGGPMYHPGGPVMPGYAPPEYYQGQPMMINAQGGVWPNGGEPVHMGDGQVPMPQGPPMQQEPPAPVAEGDAVAAGSSK